MRLGVKLATTTILTVAILILLSMIRGTIADRQSYRHRVVHDVGTNFGGPQAFAGPVLVVPYTEMVGEEDPKGSGTLLRVFRERTDQLTFFPETLNVEGVLKPDVRKRGLHEVRVYEWEGSAHATFSARLPQNSDGVRLKFGEPYLSYGIADVRGLRNTPTLVVDGQSKSLVQGIGHADGTGLHTRLDAPVPGGQFVLDTRIKLQLRGTETFSLLPVAKSNDLRTSSNWLHPKFEGISPEQEIDSRGFRARWQVASIATDAQRQYRSKPGVNGLVPGPAQVSVSLVDPVNRYSMADRATKYALLFIGLTFTGFFIIELLERRQVHPIQYALVGLAIAIFFLLLLALSEHMAFGASYVVAAAACVGLIGYYLAGALQSIARAGGFAATLGTLYACLYGLLISEDNALILGSGLLFAILAAVMVLTRKVDWYQVAAPETGAR